MAKYLSNKFKSLKIGIDGFSENLTSLSIIGKVGVGATLSLNSVTGIVSAVSFKKIGGTSSQFLMADGSTNTSTFLTSYTETDTLDNVLGRGNISGIGLSVGVVTSTSFRGDLIGNVTGNTSGNAGTATSLATARTIGGVSFDGTSSINLPGVNAIGNQNTTGNADTATTAGIVTTAAQPNITSLGTLASLTVQGNVSVGGTLTYEDVTNVDALGIVTARSGIHVGPISAGVATVTTDGSATFIGIITAASFVGDGSNLSNLPASGISDVVSDSSPQLGGNLDVNGKDIIGTGNANLTGIVTATTFSSGLLRIGYSTSIPLAGGFDPSIQQVGTNLNSSTFGLYRFTADSSAPSIRFIKSRSSDPSSRGLVQFGDELGRISFIGDDGNDIANGGALISAHVDGVASATADMPARLSFHTAPDGTAGGQERLTIKNDGKIGIGNTLPTQMLDVGGTVKATSFSGNGANLTSLSAANLTGSLPAISGANLTDVLTTGVGGQTGNLTVAGIASVGIGTTGDPLVGKVDLFHEGEIRLKTTPAGIQVVGVLSATSLDFTGANGAFNDDLLLKGASANAKWDKSESYLQFNDGAKAVFGTDVSSGDLEIYHSGSQSYINEDGTGELLITTGIGTTAAKVSDGSITLYHQGTERLRTTASGVTISGNISGTISGTINGNASTATDLAITGATEQLVIQTGNNATDVIASGTAGYVLQSNGSGNAPTWAAGAPANAISGITIREDGALVGSANSISTINFTGAGVGVTFTQPTAGIATVTISAGGDSASPVMMSMIFG